MERKSKEEIAALEMMENLQLHKSPAKYVEWKIPKFTQTKPYIFVTGPSFKLPGAREEWFMKYCIKGYSIKQSIFVKLYLCRESSEVEHSVTFRIGIKEVDGFDNFEFKATEMNETFGKHADCFETGLIELHRKHFTKHLNPDGALTVFCSAFIVDMPQLTLAIKASVQSAISGPLNTASETPSPVTTEKAESQTISSDGDSSLFEDFKNMYINRQYSDVTIFVKKKVFYAHRCVLSVRSAVFGCIFQRELAEKSSGKVEVISDCDPDSFEEFILFLYTGKLDSVSSSKAMNLYKTADKYDVHVLKRKCVDIMIRDLCIDSFCDVIRLASMHSECDLLKVATDFFIENVENIVSTTKWQQFAVENYTLSNELILKFVKSKK